MANGIVRARLRIGKDDDITEALEAALATKDEADILREALRVYFGLEGVVRTHGRAIVPRSQYNTAEAKLRAPGHTRTAAPTIEKVQEQEPSTAAEKSLDELLGF